MEYFVGVDVGGTFTDCTIMDEEGNVSIGKSPSRPQDLSAGVLDAIRVTAESIGMGSEELLKQAALVSHAGTVATNAFLTRSGAKVGLITTAGFEDTIFMMRAVGRFAGLREDQIKRMGKTKKPEPIVPKTLVKGVRERVDYKGAVLIPLDRKEAERVIKDLVDKGVRAIAVSLLWSPANPSHEREIKRMISENYPDIYVTISSDLVPITGEYERTSSSVINAYLGPAVSGYLNSLDKQLKAGGSRYSPLIMQSYGGSLSVDQAVVRSAGMISSGPVAGAIGSRFLAESLGYRNVITTDVGGTSFDVGLIYDGELKTAAKQIIGQYDLVLPAIEVTSIGTGSGSVAWLEPVTNVLKVGPQSAGAEPGPACYDRGGTEPTVTDADLVLNYLNPEYFLGGRMKLNKEKSIEAIKNRIADPLGMSVVEAAAGIYDIVNAHMVDLVRAVTVGSGYDPAKCVVFAYGGAGPLHATSYGRGMQAIIVPFTASVHSAMGLLTSDIMYTYEFGAPRAVPVDADWFNTQFQRLEEKAVKDLRGAGFEDDEMNLRRFVDMRYIRQVHEVRTPAPLGRLGPKELEGLYDAFEELYERLYGKGAAYREAGMQVVTFRLEAMGKIRKPTLRRYDLKGKDASGALKNKRDIYLRKAGGFVSADIYDLEKLQAGNLIGGPAVIESPVTTILIDVDQTGKVDEYLDVVIMEK